MTFTSHCLAWFYMAGDMFCCLAWTECGTLSLSVEDLAQPMTPDLWVTMGITVALITMDDCNAASCWLHWPQFGQPSGVLTGWLETLWCMLVGRWHLQPATWLFRHSAGRFQHRIVYFIQYLQYHHIHVLGHQTLPNKNTFTSDSLVQTNIREN